MPSKSDVVNEALGLIGEMPIDDPDNPTTNQGREMKAVYALSARACLEHAVPNFAASRSKLVKTSTTPAFAYAYQFSKPVGWMRTIAIYEDTLEAMPTTDWTDEGGFILGNASDLYMRFLDGAKVDTPGAWPQLFADWVSADMAFRRNERLAPSMPRTEYLAKLTRSRRATFMAWDAQGNPPRPLPQGRWVRSRWGTRGTLNGGERT